MTAKETAKSLMSECLTTIKVVNGILTKTECVPPTFQGHYFGKENGLKGLIRKILSENAKSVFKAYGKETSGLFPHNMLDVCDNETIELVSQSAMRTEQIIEKVIELFTLESSRYVGSDRKAQSIKNCLSTYMKKDGTIGHIETNIQENLNGEKTKSQYGWFLTLPIKKPKAQDKPFDFDLSDCESVLE